MKQITLILTIFFCGGMCLSKPTTGKALVECSGRLPMSTLVEVNLQIRQSPYADKYFAHEALLTTGNMGNGAFQFSRVRINCDWEQGDLVCREDREISRLRNEKNGWVLYESFIKYGRRSTAILMRKMYAENLKCNFDGLRDQSEVNEESQKR